MLKNQKKFLLGNLLTGLSVPFLGGGIKALWAAGGISNSDAVASLTGTIVNIVGGGQTANIKNAILFVLGKAGNYSNWYDMAWSMVDLITVFLPGGWGVRLAVAVPKLVATL